jgi:hypothetical protein
MNKLESREQEKLEATLREMLENAQNPTCRVHAVLARFYGFGLNFSLEIYMPLS